ncbi:MAG: DUF4313 domain-containing protein, partial [Clostridiales bacterium]|nr:DUF4313 domain-containing protein [Clostridiales bacterium]
FIQKNKLGTVLPEVGYSGYGQYAKAAFDMDRLKKFDPIGVERHMKQYQQAAKGHQEPDISQKNRRSGR